jgi:P-type E1-E2 ATPase
LWFLSNGGQHARRGLVAASPCALALAAAIAGIAVAARHGILIRGSAFLEELADTSVLVVDKTGTLTSGYITAQDRAVPAPQTNR